MNAIGIKSNRKSVQLGNKQPHSGYLLGHKATPKSDVIAVAKSNANINEQDSNVIDSQKMPTGIDKSKSFVASKSNLERPNKR